MRLYADYMFDYPVVFEQGNVFLYICVHSQIKICSI